MAEIVFIHGIDEQEESADIILSQWIPALAGGLRLTGESDLADKIEKGVISTDLVYYGDLFRAPDLPTAIDFDKVAAEIINQLAKVPALANAGMWIADQIKPYLIQVNEYFTNTDLCSTILRRAEAAIMDETRVVFAHSLGSVVAYEAVSFLKNRLPLLITAGSPLGLHTIITEQLVPPPSFPGQVDLWMNLANANDIVACNPHLNPLFGNVHDYVYDQPSDNPHDPVTYLGRTVVANYIAREFNG